MKIATWNVNSLRVRLPQVLAWLTSERPDVLALQEIKLADAECPVDEVRAVGYHPLYAGQKGYNGVALFSRRPPAGQVADRFPNWDDDQRRLLATTYELDGTPLRAVNLYVPNGSEVGSEKYAYKLRWLERLGDFLAAELALFPNLAVLGDFNIAPEPRDVHAPRLWQGRVMFSEPERAAFRRLLALGLVDAFRLFDQPAALFTWWDYRLSGFRRNLGLRIDHILLSPALAKRCTGVRIDKVPRGWERPSDHAPVIAELAPQKGMQGPAEGL